MKSRRTASFREAFAALPEPVREQARLAYRRFHENPNHPGLRFKRVHPSDPVYSVRIGLGYRAVGVREDDVTIWFWIGSHADYDRRCRDAGAAEHGVAADSPPSHSLGPLAALATARR